MLLDIEVYKEAFYLIKDSYSWLFYIFYIAFAASIGSFLGCCYYRIPKKMSLINPKKSFCPHCKAELTFVDLIPILSYVLLRAKCRHCHVKIAPTYFIIESLTVLIFISFVL